MYDFINCYARMSNMKEKKRMWELSFCVAHKKNNGYNIQLYMRDVHLSYIGFSWKTGTRRVKNLAGECKIERTCGREHWGSFVHRITQKLE